MVVDMAEARESDVVSRFLTSDEAHTPSPPGNSVTLPGVVVLGFMAIVLRMLSRPLDFH